jgi:hypothetical protein
MAATIGNRALDIIKQRTTRRLYDEIKGPSSFALDQACRLHPEAKSAALAISDSWRQLNSDTDVILALGDANLRPSQFADCLDGIRIYALNRRNAI